MSSASETPVAPTNRLSSRVAFVWVKEDGLGNIKYLDLSDYHLYLDPLANDTRDFRRAVRVLTKRVLREEGVEVIDATSPEDV